MSDAVSSVSVDKASAAKEPASGHGDVALTPSDGIKGGERLGRRRARKTFSP